MNEGLRHLLTAGVEQNWCVFRSHCSQETEAVLNYEVPVKSTCIRSSYLRLCTSVGNLEPVILPFYRALHVHCRVGYHILRLSSV